MNKKIISSILLASTMLVTSTSFSDQSKGLNLVVTAPERQAQMMAMVLSLQTIKKHGKEVNMVLCGAAGDLALKATKTDTLKPADKSPTDLLNGLIKMGATIEVCPLYLPNVGKTEADLIEGITVAKPPVVAGRLLDKDYTTLSY